MQKLLIRNSSKLAGVLAVAVAATLTVAACGSNTSIETQWQSPTANAELRKVAVIMISQNATLRRTSEDAMVQQLSVRGAQAVPGYTVLDDSVMQDLPTAKAKLRAAGFDGVVTMRLVSATQRVEAVPGGFDDYWGTAWGAAYSPGYLQTETIVRVESNAYSLINGTLLWSAISKTIDPNDTNDLIAHVTKVVAKQLELKGVVV